MISEAQTIVLLCSSAPEITGRDGRPRECGVWAEELVRPWKVFSRSGVRVVIASPDGTSVAIEPASIEPESSLLSPEDLNETRSFLDRHRAELESPTSLRAIMEHGHIDGVFIPGGYGPTAQFRTGETVGAFIDQCLRRGTPLAAVCHGVSALLTVDAGEAGLVGRAVTGFSNAEERASGADSWVPYFLESELLDHGLGYSSAEPWSCHVLEDNNIITGQNPASSEEAAHRLCSLTARERT